MTTPPTIICRACRALTLRTDFLFCPKCGGEVSPSATARAKRRHKAKRRSAKTRSSYSSTVWLTLSAHDWCHKTARQERLGPNAFLSQLLHQQRNNFAAITPTSIDGADKRRQGYVLSPEDKDELREAAQAQGCTLSDLVRGVVQLAMTEGGDA